MSLRLVVPAQPTVVTGRPSAQFKGDKSSGSACYPTAQGPRPTTHYPKLGSANRPYILFIDNLREAQADQEREDWASNFIRDSRERGDFEKRICWDRPIHMYRAHEIPNLSARLQLARAIFIRAVEEDALVSRLPAFASVCGYFASKSAAPLAVYIDQRARLELLERLRRVLAAQV